MAKKRDDNARTNLKHLKELADTLRRNNPDFVREILSSKTPEIEPVTMSEWAVTHPLKLPSGSDKFYVDLANNIQRKILSVVGNMIVPPGFIHNVAMSITAYLEDLVGGVGVWQAIRLISEAHYNGAPVPPIFEVDPDDYFVDDVNIQDIKAIIWQVLAWTARENGTSYISPYSPAIDLLANAILPILADALEKAPEPTRVVHTIHRIFASGDIFEIRRLALWLSVFCKLTAAPGMERSLDIDFGDEEEVDAEHARVAQYSKMAMRSWSDAVSIHGCPVNTILAKLALIYGFDAIAEKFEGFAYRPFTTYHVKKVEPHNILLANDGGEEFSLTTKSLRSTAGIAEAKYAYLSIFKYGSQWWCNGGSMFFPVLPPDYSISNINIRTQEENIRQLIHENRGRRIFFFKTREEATAFITGREDIPAIDIMANADNYTILLSDEGMMAVVPNIANIFKYKGNPFFQKVPDDKELAINYSLQLLVYNDIPDDIAKFIQDNNMLPFLEVNMRQGRRFMKQHVRGIIRPSIALYRVASPSTFLLDNDDD